MIFTKTELIAAAILLAAPCMLWSCRSQAPYPVTYTINTQQKMQAIHHWDILAEDVANQVMMTVEQHPGIETQPVTVLSPDENTAFALMFHNLLASHLVKRGLVLAPSNKGSLVLS